MTLWKIIFCGILAKMIGIVVRPRLMGYLYLKTLIQPVRLKNDIKRFMERG